MVTTRRLLITSLISALAVFSATILLAGLAVQTLQPERYYSEASSQYAASLIARTIASLEQN